MHQDEPNVKRPKIKSECTRETRMRTILFSSEHNNATLSNCESNESCGDVSSEKAPNVCEDVVDFMTNFNTKPASEQQQSTEESNHHEREVATFISDQKHIDELPVELLVLIFDYLSLGDLCAIRQTNKQWRQIAGYLFQQNYSTVQSLYGYKKKHAFIQLIRNICIGSLSDFPHFLDKKPDFQQQ